MKITRRHFLHSTATLAAVAAMGGPVWAAESKPKRQYKKAIMWDTFGMKGTVLEKFRALKDAGFQGVEASSHMNQDEVAKAYAETGLECASVCGSRHWGKPLSAPDEKVRADGVAALKQTLRDAKRYGGTSILLVPGVGNKDVTYEQCWERSIAGIREALPLAEELGVKIAIENVWNNFLMKPQQAKDYLAAINHPLVGWHFDIGNMVKFGPSEEWIKVLGKSILKLHIKDYSNTGKGFGVKLTEGDAPRLARACWSAVGAQAIEQPGAREHPVTLERGHRDAERRRGLALIETAEEAQLHHRGGARIDRLERLQRLVECQEFVVASDSQAGGVVDGDAHAGAWALLGVAMAGVIHEGPSHLRRHECNQMRAVVHCHAVPAEEA